MFFYFSSSPPKKRICILFITEVFLEKNNTFFFLLFFFDIAVLPDNKQFYFSFKRHPDICSCSPTWCAEPPPCDPRVSVPN